MNCRQLEQAKKEAEVCEAYLGEKLSQHEVAKKLGISVGSVCNILKRQGNKSRSRSEVQRGKKLSEEHKRHLSEAGRGRLGNKHNSWRGGRRVSNGYIYIMSHTHPHADNRGYVAEHRLVMEGCLGRPLLPTEVVHHINGIKDDNRIENLMLFSSFNDHLGFHRNQKKKHKKSKE